MRCQLIIASLLFVFNIKGQFTDSVIVFDGVIDYRFFEKYRIKKIVRELNGDSIVYSRNMVTGTISETDQFGTFFEYTRTKDGKAIKCYGIIEEDCQYNFGYDAKGRLIKTASEEYEYNESGRLSTVKKYGPVSEMTILYQYSGRRPDLIRVEEVMKSEDPKNATKIYSEIKYIYLSPFSFREFPRPNSPEVYHHYEISADRLTYTDSDWQYGTLAGKETFRIIR